MEEEREEVEEEMEEEEEAMKHSKVAILPHNHSIFKHFTKYKLYLTYFMV